MTMQGNEIVLLALVILIIGIFLMLSEGGGAPQASEAPAPPEPQAPQGDADPFQSAQADPQDASPAAPSDSGGEQDAFKAPGS